MANRNQHWTPSLDGLTDDDAGHPPEPATPSVIHDAMSFTEMCERFKCYFTDKINTPQNVRALKASTVVTRLAEELRDDSQNPATLAALLWCRAQFAFSADDDSGEGVDMSRAMACELVACEFTSALSAADALRYLCFELPSEPEMEVQESGVRPGNNRESGYGTISESSTFLSGFSASGDVEEGPGSDYVGLNTLEIAVMADAKRFISHRPVQMVINGIWDGSISFWKKLDIHGSKTPHFYNARKGDPYLRLRVPKYQKVFEAAFFTVLLALYYVVLAERNPHHITASEGALFVFFTAFIADEISSIIDSGVQFYAQDLWSLLDLCMVAIGVIYLVLRIIGVVEYSDDITDTAFDVLSLEALLLVPRVFSLLTLNQYFGVLIPCLKQMTKEFCQFCILVVIIYCGFLTTFSLLARDRMSLKDTAWLLIYVFFGSSYAGFSAMREISPVLGPPLMIIFVTLTNILLITSLISLLSNSLTSMMSNAREEYLFMFSIMVLESSTSNRLVVFFPPLNLLPLILLRPLRLILPAARLRGLRIALLKASHFPFAAAIMAYERITGVKETRHTNWGPARTPGAGASISSVSRRPPLAGLGIFSSHGNHRRSIVGLPSEWTGRLRLGPQAPVQNHHHHHYSQHQQQPTKSSASSTRSARARTIGNMYRDQDTMGDDVRDQEMRRMGKMLEELTRKVDAILEHHGTA
ncbi:hypothetical protein EX30DRAFT_394705 [Ascodesmis nigricans]|uniref:Calcium channel YVC1-like C-terminal transmembrane domain-containing protein n=1 Tax=Ascodesmis nigricans TaxID=341454 RepID=A0A4V3SJ29_9PEZI|nr:hypothetical protein EX30DRAFT_394705 [Ascodesmis nigricans]